MFRGSCKLALVAIVSAVLLIIPITGLVAAPPAHAADAGKLVMVLDSSGSMKERVGASRTSRSQSLL